MALGRQIAACVALFAVAALLLGCGSSNDRNGEPFTAQNETDFSNKLDNIATFASEGRCDTAQSNLGALETAVQGVSPDTDQQAKSDLLDLLSRLGDQIGSDCQEAASTTTTSSTESTESTESSTEVPTDSTTTSDSSTDESTKSSTSSTTPTTDTTAPDNPPGNSGGNSGEPPPDNAPPPDDGSGGITPGGTKKEAKPIKPAKGPKGSEKPAKPKKPKKGKE